MIVKFHIKVFVNKNNLLIWIFSQRLDKKAVICRAFTKTKMKALAKIILLQMMNLLELLPFKYLLSKATTRVIKEILK